MGSREYRNTVPATLLWLIRLLVGLVVLGVVVGVICLVAPIVIELSKATGELGQGIITYAMEALEEAGVTTDGIQELLEDMEVYKSLETAAAAIAVGSIMNIIYILTIVAFPIMDAIGATMLRFSGRGSGLLRFTHAARAGYYAAQLIELLGFLVLLISIRNEMAMEAVVAIGIILSVFILVTLLVFFYHKDIAAAMKAIGIHTRTGEMALKKTHLSGLSIVFGIVSLLVLLPVVGLAVSEDAAYQFRIMSAVMLLLPLKYFLVAACYNKLKKCLIGGN